MAGGAERWGRILGAAVQLVGSPILRIAAPLIVMGLFYWALFLSPGGARGSKLTPEESRALVNRSRTLLREHNYEAALEPVLKLREAYPDNHIYAAQAAEIYDRLQRYEEETELWEEFRENAPRPEEACPQIGQAYQKRGLSKEALSAFEWCLALAPNDPDAMFYLAHALERDGQFDRAAELYRRGVSAAPKYADLRVGLARVLLHQGRAGEAKEAVDQVLGQQPRNSDGLFVLGMIYFQQGDLVQARHYLEKGAREADGGLDFQVALAELAEKEKNLPEAILHYSRALEISPQNGELRARRNALLKRR